MKEQPICNWCNEVIRQGDRVLTLPALTPDGPTTISMHVVCEVRSLCGGVAHILKRCPCFGGNDPNDPPGATRYQSAVMAAALWSTIDE